MSYLGWAGNVLLCLGIWEIGNRRRRAHLITVVGEAAWIIKSFSVGQYDLAFICCVFAVLAFRCWVKWGQPDPLSKEQVSALIDGVNRAFP
jgi:hypothetical protein